MALFGKKKKGVEEVAPAAPPQEADQEKEAAKETSVVPKVKVRPDVYTLLLGLSVVALVIATILLYLNVNAYGPNPLAGFPRG